MNETMTRAWLVTLLLIGGAALAQETPVTPDAAREPDVPILAVPEAVVPAPEAATADQAPESVSAPEPAASDSAGASMPAPVSAALPEQAVAAADALAAANLEQESEGDGPAEDESGGQSVGDGDQPVVASSGGTRTMSGMSILGNEEAPKSLVIVPWKSSQIGDGIGVSQSMNDRAIPVDREVFMREVRYYELRSGG